MATSTQDNTGPVTGATPEFAVPSVKAVKKAVEEFEPLPRDYVELPDNLAKNWPVAKAFHDTAHNRYIQNIALAERTELDKKLQDADAKFRMAPPKVQRFRTGSSQKADNLSNVASSQYYKSVSLLTSAINSILFSEDGEPPIEYRSVEGSKDYTPVEGERIAQERNAWFSRWWDMEGVEQTLKDMVLFAEKNSVEIFTVQWEYETQTAIERVPGFYTKAGEPVEFDPANPEVPPEGAFTKAGDPIGAVVDTEGRPLSYAFIEKTRVVKNNPYVKRIDIANIQWDLTIPMCDQVSIVIKSDKTGSELLAKQRDGEYENVELLGRSQMRTEREKNGERNDADRQANADESYTSGKANGMYEVYHIWQYSSIDENGKNAKWDADAIPHVYEGVYAGNFGTYMGEREADDDSKANGCVCLQLRRNPYHHGRIPYYEIYSHVDEKIGPKMGNIDLLSCIVEEMDTNRNDHYDNRRLRTFAPMLAEKNNVLERSLKFRRANHTIWCRNLSHEPLKQLKVDDITQQTIPTEQMLKSDAEEITRTTDVVQGNFAGSRTTGFEVQNAQVQAQKPIIEMAKQVGAFLPIIARDAAELAQQFANPAEPMQFEGNKFTPAEFYGESEIRVVSIEKYEHNIIAQQVMINFLQAGGYDKSREYMGIDGGLEFWRTYAKVMKMPRYDRIYPGVQHTMEAENQAMADWNLIYANPAQAMNDPAALPKPGEMHPVHIKVLSEELRQFQAQIPFEPPDKQQHAQLVVAATQAYIQMHESLMQAEGQAAIQDQQAAAQQGGVQNQAASVPSFPSEAGGDTLSGIQGQVTA